MKKYRVISENLDWLRIPKNAIIEEVGTNMYVFYTNLNLAALIGNTEMYQALILHPEWFSEIKEETDKLNFTLADMVDFGRHVQELTKAPIVSVDAHVLDKWIQKAHPENCIQKEESPKEKSNETFPPDHPMYKAIYAKVMRGEELFAPTEKKASPKEEPKEFTRMNLIRCVESIMRIKEKVYPHEIIEEIDRWIRHNIK